MVRRCSGERCGDIQFHEFLDVSWPLNCCIFELLIFFRRYFVRSGLIRKDRLCSFVPDGFHPDTVVVRNFEGLLQALVKFQTSAEMTSNKGVVKYVTWHEF